MVTFASTIYSCNVLELIFSYPATSRGEKKKTQNPNQFEFHQQPKCSGWWNQALAKETFDQLLKAHPRWVEGGVGGGVKGIPNAVWPPRSSRRPEQSPQGLSPAIRHHLRAPYRYCKGDVRTAAAPSQPVRRSPVLSPVPVAALPAGPSSDNFPRDCFLCEALSPFHQESSRKWKFLRGWLRNNFQNKEIYLGRSSRFVSLRCHFLACEQGGLLQTL